MINKEPSSRVVFCSLAKNSVSKYLLKVNNKDDINVVIVDLEQVFVHWENPVTYQILVIEIVLFSVVSHSVFTCSKLTIKRPERRH